MTIQIATLPVLLLQRGRARTPRPDAAAAAEFSLAVPGGQRLGDFAREHGLELTRFAYLVSADRGRAEDLVQDVLLAMHRRFGDRLDIEQPLAYARRAIVNANISWARRRASTEVLTGRDVERPTRDSDPSDSLWQLVARLPHRQRVVLVMRYHLGFDDAAIAETLGCRRATVRSLAARALADLRTSDELTTMHTCDEGTSR